MSVAKLQLISAGGEFQYIYTLCAIILGLAQFPLPYLAQFTDKMLKNLLKLLTPWGTVNSNLFVFFINYLCANYNIYGLEITYSFLKKILCNICHFKTFADAEFVMYCST